MISNMKSMKKRTFLIFQSESCIEYKIFMQIKIDYVANAIKKYRDVCHYVYDYHRLMINT